MIIYNCSKGEQKERKTKTHGQTKNLASEIFKEFAENFKKSLDNIKNI